VRNISLESPDFDFYVGCKEFDIGSSDIAQLTGPEKPCISEDER
jgi:hypothetical protein